MWLMTRGVLIAVAGCFVGAMLLALTGQPRWMVSVPIILAGLVGVGYGIAVLIMMARDMAQAIREGWADGKARRTR